MNSGLRPLVARLSAIAAVLLAATGACAATSVWTGTGDWFSAAGNWSGGVPGPGGSALIASGSVTLTNDSGPLASLMMTNGTLTFSGLGAIAQAADVAIIRGTVRHATNSATATNAAGVWPIDGRVHFVCSNFFLGSNGAINVDGCGWGASTSGAAYGPGAGIGASFRAGAGYGGFGANNAGDGGGLTYGSASAPDQPGSGGLSSIGSLGGSGGGVVRIDSSGGVVTINGLVTASGKSAAVARGGGSGGGIWISCRVFSGANGVIQANGENTGPAGGGNYSGGGGRVSIRYDAAAQATAPPATVTIKASRGVAAVASYRGDVGTIYLPDAILLRETLDYVEGQIVGPWSFWGPTNLTVGNRWVRFAADGFTLAVSNTLTIDGTNALLELGGASFMSRECHLAYSDSMDGSGTLFQGRFQYAAAASTLRCGGDLVLTNAARMRIFSGPTNGSEACGASVDIGGAAILSAGSWIHPVSNPTNGGSVGFRMRRLTVATNAGFSADQVGYGGGGGVRGSGYGPGAGRSNQAGGSGGGYGGTGGDYGAVAGGLDYGCPGAPVEPGSGGGRSGTNATPAYSGGSGGGLIRLEVAETLALDGLLTANGRFTGWAAGAGSGGGIYVRCRNLTGSGALAARGGDASSGGGGGATGGGGRIAVVSRYREGFSGTVSVDPGDNTKGARLGATGTVVWITDSPPSGAVTIVR